MKERFVMNRSFFIAKLRVSYSPPAVYFPKHVILTTGPDPDGRGNLLRIFFYFQVVGFKKKTKRLDSFVELLFYKIKKNLFIQQVWK
ncbi:MAG: hypothetical protein D3914_10380 [Candidatus Electrothrix sp. LOE2]|nr:hypothetical protein [Candidatus Electrothrix sp. LOE2]